MGEKEKPNVSTIYSEVEDRIEELRDALIGLAEIQQKKKDEIRENFKVIMERLRHSYRQLINPSVIKRDGKWIMVRYWDKRGGKEYIVEVFKRKMPTKEGLKDYAGYYVLIDGEFAKGSNACEIIEVEWGKDSAPRHLWNYLNKIADDEGVEKAEETFESFREK